MYTIDGTIVKDFDVTFELSGGATFDDEPVLGIHSSTLPLAEYRSYTTKTAGKGKSSVTFSVTPGTSAKPLGDNGVSTTPARLFLLYNIQNIDALQTAGGKIEMTAKIKMATNVGESTSFEDETVTIFTSSSVLSAEIKAEEEGGVYVSVDDDSKLFTDNKENDPPDPDEDTTADGFRDTTTARIGYIKLSAAKVFEPNGVVPFEIGNGLGSAGTGSELVINLGQFAASQSGLGQVRLLLTTGPITAVSTDGSTVTFPLTDQILKDLVADSAGDYANTGVPIEIVVDEVTAVNLIEEAPKATLTLAFDDENVKVAEDFTAKVTDVPLRIIYSNGSVCWAFNLPALDVQDKYNIRITNESAVPGILNATVYPTAGGDGETKDLANIGVLVSAKTAGKGTDDVLKNYLLPGQTLFLNHEALLANGFADWSNERRVLRLVSKLPKVEMLALLRNQMLDDASNPLINMSLGAHGKSCIQGR